MLHFETVTERTLEILRGIQSNAFFKELRLVGGTSLALQFGHRKSVDLDFFGAIDEPHEAIILELTKLGIVETIKASAAVKIFTVDEVKVDFVNYPCKWLQAPVFEDCLILAGDKDIAAMKISAITGRGSKKIFIDLHLLLQSYSLAEILRFYSEKYPEGSEYLALKSMVYFQDADEQEAPEMMIPISWKEIKEIITLKHKEYLDL